MSHRKARFASTLHHCLAEILSREISDPRLCSLTVMDLEIGSDLRSARVYLHSMKGQDDPAAALARAKGFIRSRIAKKMFLKFVPEIEFSVQEGPESENHAHYSAKPVAK